MGGSLQFDKIGYWSEIKLEILKHYATEYSKILAAQTRPALYHVYIDAFAGAGVHLARGTEDFVAGSPLNALRVEPPFREFHLIDIEQEKIDNLRQLIGNRKDVFLYQGDCNRVLVDTVFPRVKWEAYRRGLCILDPYGLHLDWNVILQAGQMRTLDIFLNFPVADMNRNVLWRNPEKVDQSQMARMTAFWGDMSWRNLAYRTEADLFGKHEEKEPNKVIAEAFRQRLRTVAGFKRVPDPLPMKNSRGAVVYYLFFASQVDTAEKIILHLFDKFRQY